jgi:hypothetical protein
VTLTEILNKWNQNHRVHRPSKDANSKGYAPAETDRFLIVQRLLSDCAYHFLPLPSCVPSSCFSSHSQTVSRSLPSAWDAVQEAPRRCDFDTALISIAAFLRRGAYIATAVPAPANEVAPGWESRPALLRFSRWRGVNLSKISGGNRKRKKVSRLFPRLRAGKEAPAGQSLINISV